MDKVIEIPGFGVIIKENVVNAIQAIFLTNHDIMSKDWYILVSENTKALCNLVYVNDELNCTIHEAIRACKRLGDSEAELVRIVDFDTKPLLISRIEQI
jgi:hypothetical protein